jgi:alkaline phosphatase
MIQMCPNPDALFYFLIMAGRKSGEVRMGKCKMVTRPKEREASNLKAQGKRRTHSKADKLFFPTKADTTRCDGSGAADTAAAATAVRVAVSSCPCFLATTSEANEVEAIANKRAKEEKKWTGRRKTILVVGECR